MPRVTHRRAVPVPAEDPELTHALEAVTAPELREFVRGVVDALGPNMQRDIVGAATASAVGRAGRRPRCASQRLIDNAQSFAEAAIDLGYADPADVTEHLRLGSKVFLAGDHASARGVFAALLLPIAGAEINLGEHELVVEVLGVDPHTCVAQYVASVYTTTQLEHRADAVLRAMEQVQGVSPLLNPIKEMEDVSAGALPDLGAFLPLWVKRLGRFRCSKDDWEADQERWLSEAVFRMDGVAGLERIARKTKRPHACLAWCEALADAGRWPEALRAYDAAATLVAKARWRGQWLDGSALAAQQLGRSDVPRRLETAWRSAPSLPRLLRWLASDHSLATRRAKARKALTSCPKTAGRQLGLLRVLGGDLPGAADVLSKAAGLGWSSEDHPGHLMFPLLAVLLTNGTARKANDALLAELESTCRDLSAALADEQGASRRPELATPSPVALIHDLRASIKMTDADRAVAIGAMRVAAEKRVEGILGNSRRQHYSHAALLVASCLAFAPKSHEAELSMWFMKLRQQYLRRSAFRQELTLAFVSLGVSAPA